jgi:hypothetical protein
MDTTVDLNRELTAEERRAMFSILWMSCKMGKLEHGKIVSVAGQFLVAPKTVSRVWKHILSVMGAHLTNELMFAELELFDSKMLPLKIELMQTTSLPKKRLPKQRKLMTCFNKTT